MPAEGYLGKHTIRRERSATGLHPPVILHLPLSEAAKAAPIPIGTVLKRVDGEGGEPFYETLLSSDGSELKPFAVVDDNFDPDIDQTGFALCVLHGGVKARLLKTGDGKELTAAQMAGLFETGIYPV